MQINTSDAVVVHLVSATKDLEEAAAAAIDLIRLSSAQPGALKELVIQRLAVVINAGETARRNLRDREQAKRSPDSPQ